MRVQAHEVRFANVYSSGKILVQFSAPLVEIDRAGLGCILSRPALTPLGAILATS